MIWNRYASRWGVRRLKYGTYLDLGRIVITVRRRSDSEIAEMLVKKIRASQ